MKKLLLPLIIVLIIVTSVQLWATKDQTDQKQEVEKVEVKAETQIGGAFTLIDQNGKTVQDTDFRGKVMLVFFGFTHCPDVCPVTMTVMTRTMELLGPKAEQVVPIFVTVDPERDTPAVLAEFTRNFDKRIIALTGTTEQVKQTADSYKVYFAKAEMADAKEKAEYNMDHSAYIYVMGKDGQFIKVFPYNVSEQEFANAIDAVLR